jgi:Flp pilus assembly secretin CpaC
MSMCRNLCFAVVLILANRHCVYGQSEQLPNPANANAPNEPQIALRLRFFELNDNPATRSAFAELTDKPTDTDSAEPTVSSQNVDEIVQSTEQLTRFLDDLCKVSNGKVLSESQMLMSPGVQARYQHGEEMDFTKSPPKLIKLIEMSDSVDSDAASVDAASNGSIRLVGTTILATGTIGTNQSVKLNVFAEYAEIDNSTKTKFAGRKVHSTAVNVVLKDDQSLMLGPWQSHRVEVRTEKMPVLGSLPGIGSAFGRKISTARSTIVLVMATTEIVKP